MEASSIYNVGALGVYSSVTLCFLLSFVTRNSLFATLYTGVVTIVWWYVKLNIFATENALDIILRYLALLIAWSLTGEIIGKYTPGLPLYDLKILLGEPWIRSARTIQLALVLTHFGIYLCLYEFALNQDTPAQTTLWFIVSLADLQIFYCMLLRTIAFNAADLPGKSCSDNSKISRAMALMFILNLFIMVIRLGGFLHYMYEQKDFIWLIITPLTCALLFQILRTQGELEIDSDDEKTN